MKRTIALLLSALLALSATSALGSEVMTLDEKLALQLQNGSGLIVAADFSASSDLDLSVLDEQMNTLLKALLPGSRLDIKRVQGAGSGNRGKEDMTLTLSRAGAPLADLRHTSDGVLESFTSSLFGGKSYASARGDGLLLDLLMDRGTAWPGLERAIYAVYGADLEWRKQADAQLKAVSDKLSLWLQGYTRVSTERDAQNQLITVNTITIPMADLKARMKTLLADLYANRTLSGLLREVMTAAESAAYLEPSMLQGFSAAIDRLPVSGNVSISRRYNAAGRTLLDDMTLPMGGTRGVESLHYRMEAAGSDSDKTLLEIAMQPKAAGQSQGSFYSLSLEGGPVADDPGGSMHSFTGTLLIRNEPEGTEGFTVQAGEKDDERTYEFNLSYDQGIEEQDAQTRQYTRAQEYSLLIKPQDIEGEGDQSMTLKVTLSSGADTRSATRFEGTFSWQDMSNETKVEAAVSGGSAAPWLIPSGEAAGAIRLDRMNESELARQKTGLQADLLAAVTRLGIAFLMPKP